MGDVKAVAEPHLVSHRLAKERLASLLSLDDVQAESRRRLPKAIYEYVASGSEDEQTLWENRQGFKRLLIWPRVMKDVSTIDMRCALLTFSLNLEQLALFFWCCRCFSSLRLNRYPQPRPLRGLAAGQHAGLHRPRRRALPRGQGGRGGDGAGGAEGR